MSDKKSGKNITTDILNTQFPKEDVFHSLSMPVYNSAAFEFSSAEEMEAAFLGKIPFHTYTRISNPTIEYFESRVKTASGAMAVTALSSGMAAISNTFINIAFAGANIVTTTHLFGNTFSLLQFTLAAFGVEVRFCNILDPEELEKNIDENTCAVFAELITNPHLEVIDLNKTSAITKAKKIPLIIDTTLVPWCAFKAKDFGVDIEVVSSTKYISGGATSIGGLIIDHGIYNWIYSKKLKESAQKFGEKAFHAKLRSEIFRNLGSCMSPQVASLQTLGLETLEVRYQRMVSSCLKLARFLQNLPEIKQVNYPGLENSPFYTISKKQFGDAPGAMLTFSLTDRKACYAFMNQLKVIRRATNLFDNKSLIIHPLSTIYGTLSPEMQQKVEVPDDMMRLSVGLEDVEDLQNDILQALRSGSYV